MQLAINHCLCLAVNTYRPTSDRNQHCRVCFGHGKTSKFRLNNEPLFPLRERWWEACSTCPGTGSSRCGPTATSSPVISIHHPLHHANCFRCLCTYMLVDAAVDPVPAVGDGVAGIRHVCAGVEAPGRAGLGADHATAAEEGPDGLGTALVAWGVLLFFFVSVSFFPAVFFFLFLVLICHIFCPDPPCENKDDRGVGVLMT